MYIYIYIYKNECWEHVPETKFSRKAQARVS